MCYQGFFGGDYNHVAGKISKGEVDEDGNWGKKLQHLHSFEGKWDGRIDIKDLKTKVNVICNFIFVVLTSCF